jgi:hypothetical protein
MEKELLDKIGERVDRIITLDMRGRGGESPIMEKLYPAARKLYGRPITAFAAEQLKERVGKGDTVFILTGLAAYGMTAETDGPVGAVAIGRALQIGLGARPVFITNEIFTEIMSKTATGGGFLVFDPKDIRRAWSKVPSATMVKGFTTDDKEAEKVATALMKEYSPKAIISVEARGPNEEGIYHVVDGTDVTQYESKMAILFRMAKEQNILTMGMFDGCGHEIGSGTLISSEVKNEYPRYATCACGCKSGMNDATQVDVAIPAAISNWGAYGVVACLSALLEKKEVMHDKALESRMVRVCADAGAMDGVTGRTDVSVDGLPESIQMAVIEILGEIVQNSIKGYDVVLKTN